MNEELMKSLVSLIDESLAELEELKKSDRFSASEIKLDGPGKGIAGKDPNGKLGKDEDEEDEEEKDEDEEKAAKAEGVNSEDKAMDKADSGMPKGTVAKAEDKKAEDKKDEGKKDGDKDNKDEDEKKDLKKSLQETSDLMKSYVNERISPLEAKLDGLVKMIKEIGDKPAPAKSESFRSLKPLAKTDANEQMQTLSKSQIVDKLFELKKSGTQVDSVDIASAELANNTDLSKIVQKYNIK